MADIECNKQTGSTPEENTLAGGVEKASPETQGAPSQGQEDSDGGFWAWSTVIGTWLIQFTGFGYANAFGVYQDYYVTNYLSDYGSSAISWIGSVQIFIQLTIGILSGRLFDKGYFYSVMIFGSVLYVFSLFMLSLAKPQQYYQVFLSQAIGAGIGSGICYIPSIAILAQHFRKPHNRALTMALIASGSSLGGTIHPIMLNRLFNSSLGFANGVRISAAFIGFLSLVAILMMRVKKTATENKTTSISLISAVKKFSKDPAYIFMIAAMFFSSQGIFFPIFYLQLDSSVHGVDSNITFYSLSILNGCSVVGRVLPGFFSRQFGVLNNLVLMISLCCAVIIGMLGIKDLAGVVSVAVLYGLFQGAYITLLAPMLTLLADHPSEIGARLGFGFSAQGLGGLIGTPITGALLTSAYIWWRPIVYSACMAFCGVLSYIGCRIMLMRKRNIKGWVI